MTLLALAVITVAYALLYAVGAATAGTVPFYGPQEMYLGLASLQGMKAMYLGSKWYLRAR